MPTIYIADQVMSRECGEGRCEAAAQKKKPPDRTDQGGFGVVLQLASTQQILWFYFTRSSA